MPVKDKYIPQGSGFRNSGHTIELSVNCLKKGQYRRCAAVNELGLFKPSAFSAIPPTYTAPHPNVSGRDSNMKERFEISALHGRETVVSHCFNNIEKEMS
ncbi:OLC1v1038723C1 [Oldenlandia corymbosa var. corymbosa]|uniref:OLC1v1038723C1 n=1 Tax=Oldenlandia corymbosa var. corymbosa TaxID=529605 RepID=A0AAV1D1G4_OLDCO|nr:OLC1v1038723C1 [Oldenlandia corymbosa var. corymbosa]